MKSRLGLVWNVVQPRPGPGVRLPPPCADPRGTFQELLNRAQGRGPVDGIALGPATRAGIDLVAREHPEATAELIANAYDAFVREPGSAAVE
jgi:hypothetical protein